MIPGVAARGLFVARGLALKIGAGHVVEQKLKIQAKPNPVALEQMGAELILVRVQHDELGIARCNIFLDKKIPHRCFGGDCSNSNRA